MSKKFDFNGKVVRMEIPWLTATKREQIDRGLNQIFVDNCAQGSDYTFIHYPAEGNKLIEAWIN